MAAEPSAERVFDVLHPVAGKDAGDTLTLAEVQAHGANADALVQSGHLKEKLGTLPAASTGAGE